MVNNKRGIFLCGVLLFSMVFGGAVDRCDARGGPKPYVRQAEGGSLDFNWSLLGVRKGKNALQVVQIQRDTALRSGDQLMFNFEPRAECYLYLLYSDVSGKFQLLFPSSGKGFARALRTGEKVSVPDPGGKMELDNQSGDETVYLLVSAVRLEALEGACQQLLSPSAAEGVDSDRKLLSEVRSAIRTNSQNAATIAEVPARIAGTLRGAQKPAASASELDVSKYSIHVTARNFYAKKIVIHHR